MYALSLSKAAKKQLRKLPVDAQTKVAAAIDALAEQPRPNGVVKLSGRQDYRIRIGSYRVIYEIEDAQLLILVVAIGDRKNVYR